MSNRMYSLLKLNIVQNSSLLVVTFLLWAFATTANAQEVDQGQGDASIDGSDVAAEEVEEIIVTGSRIKRSEYTMTQALIKIDEQDIRNRGFDNVAQALNDIPSLGFLEATMWGEQAVPNSTVGSQTGNSS